jgi:hypothetical protein
MDIRNFFKSPLKVIVKVETKEIIKIIETKEIIKIIETKEPIKIIEKKQPKQLIITEDLYKRFYDGFYLLTGKEFIKEEWKYAGGDEGRHLRYWKMINKNKQFKMPSKEPSCICDVEIQKNCFILNTKNNNILVVGSCCVKKFLPKNQSGRTCEICGEPHKNRSNNRCNICRVGICNDCDKPCNPNYSKCYKCNFN